MRALVGAAIWLAAMAAAGPVWAQQTGHDMAGMKMPAGTTMPAEGTAPPAKPTTAPADGGQHTEAPEPAATPTPIPSSPPPPAPFDHYADRVYPADQMAAARRTLAQEHGGMAFHMLIADIAEWQVRDGRDGYRWEGEGWYGGDIDRLVVKTQGEGDRGARLEQAEMSAYFSRAIDPYWNLQAGVRQDLRGGRSSTSVALAVEGLAPYWFETEGSLFLSTHGDLLGRVSVYYDQRITQSLIVQPRAELNLAAQDIPGQRIGAGLTSAELDLRLRYEFGRQFAPYIGVSYEARTGNTARFARADGDSVRSTSLVFGIRTWF